MAAAAFENVEKATQVAVDIGARVFQRVAHPGLGSQVDHHFGLFAGKQFGYTRGVVEVQAI
ncbi:hypothetical protein D3C85_1605020 [compost metagenome]